MRDKTPKALVPVIVGLVVALGVVTGVVWTKKMDNKPDKQTGTTQNQQTADTQNTNNPGTVAYDGVEGQTALELLKTKAEVVTQESAYGEYVDSIDGVKGGTDGKYWTFYINGQMAQVGAGSYQTKAGDKIEWKFE